MPQDFKNARAQRNNGFDIKRTDNNNGNIKTTTSPATVCFRRKKSFNIILTVLLFKENKMPDRKPANQNNARCRRLFLRENLQKLMMTRFDKIKTTSVNTAALRHKADITQKAHEEVISDCFNTIH